jgi:hypothetical protein
MLIGIELIFGIPQKYFSSNWKGKEGKTVLEELHPGLKG